MKGPTPLKSCTGGAIAEVTSGYITILVLGQLQTTNWGYPRPPMSKATPTALARAWVKESLDVE